MKLEQMEIFYYVALWNNFSKAAKHLGLSKGYVSKEISNLEKELKIKLFNRTTRYVGLTTEGELFLNNCTKIVEEKNLALNQMKDLNDEPSGSLTISAPPSICDDLLANIFPLFYRKYPKISLKIDSSPIAKNLSQHGIDIALRLTNDPDEKYVARLIEKYKFVICATKDYLIKNGTPKKAEDILNHNCLIYSNDPKSVKWHIGNKTIIIDGIISSNSHSLIKKCLLDGLGIAKLPDYMVREELKSGLVDMIFSDYAMAEIPMYAIYRGGANIPLKIRYFLNFLKEYLFNVV